MNRKTRQEARSKVVGSRRKLTRCKAERAIAACKTLEDLERLRATHAGHANKHVGAKFERKLSTLGGVSKP
jgi:hypothetical protein